MKTSLYRRCEPSVRNWQRLAPQTYSNAVKVPKTASRSGLLGKEGDSTTEALRHGRITPEITVTV